jgi:hypothetical protein
MSNQFKGELVVLDTFTSDILLSAVYDKTVFKLNSIEWQQPLIVGDTALIYDKNSSDKLSLFDEYCVIARQSLIKYFFDLNVRDIYIPAGSVTSGKIILIIR